MKALLLLLVTVLFIPSAQSQYKLLELNDTAKTGIEVVKLKLDKPSLDPDRMVFQLVGGNVMGILSGLGGAIVGGGVARIGSSGGAYAGLGGAAVGFVLGHCAGSILGVNLAGSTKEVTGNVTFTVLGGIVGTGAGIATLYAARKNETVQWSTLTYPTIGAMLGFNSTLYYKDKKNVSELKDLGSHLKIKNDFEVEVIKVNFEIPKMSKLSKIPESLLLSLR